MKKKQAIITVSDVTVAHQVETMERLVLKQISFTLTRGSWTAVVGANGSGKSTLARALAGLAAVRSGSITLADAAHIVLQNPETQLLGDTIEEDLQISCKQSQTVNGASLRTQDIVAILKEAGLQMPPDTPIRQLSGGQKQLLNIACCLALEANVLVLDEVTSMLDPASRELVLNLIRRLHKRGKTIVWITHRTEELVYADRVLALDQGVLSFDGTVRQFCYSRQVGQASICEQFGMELPYVVQVSRQLERRGLHLTSQPLLPEELVQAMTCHAVNR